MALWRIRATVDDRPGYLSVLTASLALRSVNILAVQVHTTEAGAVDDFLIDAPDALTEADLHAAIARGRGRDAFVCRAEAEALADQPTRALALAGRLAHDPDGLGEALVALLGAAEVRWRPDPLPGPPGFAAEPTRGGKPQNKAEGRMTLSDPGGGSYEVLRDRPSFTPAEFARAQALVEVSGAMLRHRREESTLLLPDGTELTVRVAGLDDFDAARGLVKKARMLEPAGGRTLVAVTADGRVVGLASLLAEGDLAEVSVRVADAWQRRGIGTVLVRRLLAYAERARFAAVTAHTGADNVAMLRLLRRLGAGDGERDGGLVSVTMPVPGRRPAGTR